MSPEDVPAELVEKAIAAAFKMPPGYAEAYSGVMDSLKEAYGHQYRAALAAVLPEIQAQALREAARAARASGLPFRFSQAEFLTDRAARLTTTTKEPT
jgi:hypothetical protein